MKRLRGTPSRRGSQDLSRFAGQWVALVGKRVVAHEATLPALLVRVKRRKAQPSVFLVPRKDEGPYILLVG